MSCGAALERRCASCAEPLSEGARFCVACGTPVATAPSPPAEAAPGPTEASPLPTPSSAPPSLDERRTVTVLFADLSGYTSVAERLDPESVKRQLERILGRLGEEVSRHGGHVDKFIGDNVMAIFGAPVAYGDDAVRAVRAGLAMQAAMDELNEPLAVQHDVSFELCVGINTGEVLAGHVGESYTVIGDTVNVAARLQAAARPGSVTVGEPTYRATRALIDFAALEEPLRLKGKSKPVAAWEALGTEGQPAASASSANPAMAPLVGRSNELSQLHDLLARAERRRGPHLATVIGEPGVGKSRLLRQFEQELSAHPSDPLVRLVFDRGHPAGGECQRLFDVQETLNDRVVAIIFAHGRAACPRVAPGSMITRRASR